LAIRQIAVIAYWPGARGRADALCCDLIYHYTTEPILEAGKWGKLHEIGERVTKIKKVLYFEKDALHLSSFGEMARQALAVTQPGSVGARVGAGRTGRLLLSLISAFECGSTIIVRLTFASETKHKKGSRFNGCLF
jgi:hypothetical protein